MVIRKIEISCDYERCDKTISLSENDPDFYHLSLYIYDEDWEVTNLTKDGRMTIKSKTYCPIHRLRKVDNTR